MSEAWSSLRTCIAGCHCLLEGGQCAKMHRGCASVCVLAHESERRAVEAESDCRGAKSDSGCEVLFSPRLQVQHC